MCSTKMMFVMLGLAAAIPGVAEAEGFWNLVSSIRFVHVSVSSVVAPVLFQLLDVCRVVSGSAGSVFPDPADLRRSQTLQTQSEFRLSRRQLRSGSFRGLLGGCLSFSSIIDTVELPTSFILSPFIVKPPQFHRSSL